MGLEPWMLRCESHEDKMLNTMPSLLGHRGPDDRGECLYIEYFSGQLAMEMKELSCTLIILIIE